MVVVFSSNFAFKILIKTWRDLWYQFDYSVFKQFFATLKACIDLLRFVRCFEGDFR